MTPLIFTHLFLYPFFTGIIVCGVFFAAYRRAWLMAGISMLSFTVMVWLCLTVIYNYANYM